MEYIGFLFIIFMLPDQIEASNKSIYFFESLIALIALSSCNGALSDDNDPKVPVRYMGISRLAAIGLPMDLIELKISEKLRSPLPIAQ